MATEVAPLIAKVPPGSAPNWTTRYRIGSALGKHLEPVASLDEVAAYLGTSKQNAYTFCALALGKLALQLHARFRPEDVH